MGLIQNSVNGTTKIRMSPPTSHHMSPYTAQAVTPAAVPVAAEAICNAAARRYMGGKKRPANPTPASSAAGC